MELQQLACKWIQSAQERVDIWSLSITLHEVLLRLLREAGWRDKSVKLLRQWRAKEYFSSASFPMWVWATTCVCQRITRKDADRCKASESTASSTDGRVSKISVAWGLLTCGRRLEWWVSTTWMRKEKVLRFWSTCGSTMGHRNHK